MGTHAAGVAGSPTAWRSSSDPASRPRSVTASGRSASTGSSSSSTPTGRPGSSPCAGIGSCSPGAGRRGGGDGRPPRARRAAPGQPRARRHGARGGCSPRAERCAVRRDAARRALLGGLRAELAPDPRRRPGDRRGGGSGDGARARDRGAHHRGAPAAAQRVPELAPPRLRARRDPRARHAGAAAARPGASGRRGAVHPPAVLGRAGDAVAGVGGRRARGAGGRDVDRTRPAAGPGKGGTADGRR